MGADLCDNCGHEISNGGRYRPDDPKHQEWVHMQSSAGSPKICTAMYGYNFQLLEKIELGHPCGCDKPMPIRKRIIYPDIPNQQDSRPSELDEPEEASKL